MSINNIQATNFYDEARAHFARQSQQSIAVELVIDVRKRADGATFIGIFDRNNPDAVPLVLMVNTVGTGRRWSNETSINGATFYVVNSALLAFDKQKEKWKKNEVDFQLKDATDFLVKFMKQVSDFLL